MLKPWAYALAMISSSTSKSSRSVGDCRIRRAGRAGIRWTSPRTGIDNIRRSTVFSSQLLALRTNGA